MLRPSIQHVPFRTLATELASSVCTTCPASSNSLKAGVNFECVARGLLPDSDGFGEYSTYFGTFNNLLWQWGWPPIHHPAPVATSNLQLARHTPSLTRLNARWISNQCRSLFLSTALIERLQRFHCIPGRTRFIPQHFYSCDKTIRIDIKRSDHPLPLACRRLFQFKHKRLP